LGVPDKKVDREFAALDGNFLLEALNGETANPREVSSIVRRIQRNRPRASIVLHGDSRFATENIMKWCEANDVRYIFSLKENKDLIAITKRGLILTKKRKAKMKSGKTTRYIDFDWSLSNWRRQRRVVAKRSLRGHQGSTSFVVTSLNRAEALAR